MVCKSAEETSVCTFQWTIRNISSGWWLREETPLSSPSFTAVGLDRTRWSLLVYPYQSNGELIGNEFALKLRRGLDCSQDFKVEYHLAFLGDEDSILKEGTNIKTLMCEETSSPLFLELNSKRLVKEKVFPYDSLTVQCTLRKAEMGRSSEGLLKSEPLYSTTILKVMRTSFDWQIKHFNRTEKRREFKNDTLNLDVVYEGGFFGGLDMDVISHSASLKYFSCNTSVICSEGGKESWGFKDYSFLKWGQERSPLLDFPKRILKSRKRYLKDDVLTLVFDLYLATVVHLNCRVIPVKQEENKIETILLEDLEIRNGDKKLLLEDLEIRNGDKKLLLEDLEIRNGDKKLLLEDLEIRNADKKLLLEDLEIRNGNKKLLIEDLELRNGDKKLHNSTKTSVAAKNILNARSPVLNHDVKELYSGVVDINDSEKDMLNKMLEYMYTETGLFEDFQIDNASKLFTYAVKNNMLSLKDMCSSFLIKNLNTKNALKILLLADKENDEDLRKAVEVYIMLHDMVKSAEWKTFMSANLELAARTMYSNLNHPG